MHIYNEVNGFITAKGQKLINGSGQEILLRGVGLGSWLLPEGYMWKFSSEGDRPRRMESMIRELIGVEAAACFWEEYYIHYISEQDIERIAQEGFNSVRIPINSRFLIDESDPSKWHLGHLTLLDQMIRWCEKYRVYAILDLHGAPGGQTGTNIDDSEHDLPELFIDIENQNKCISIWQMLAERYKDEWIVAGYDLLNEPLPDWFAEYNDRVMPLYKELIQVIREVDSKHMIILEGVHWATDWSIFTEMPDCNVMLQFHKYWNNPDTESIQTYLNIREKWNVPIFMGEGGENNKEWYTGAFTLFEEHSISWNFWTWKKMNTTNSPCSIQLPEGWAKLTGYLEGGERPKSDEVELILKRFIEHLKLENCMYHPEVVNALFRRAPVTIPAIFYGYKGEGESFGRSIPVIREEERTDFRRNDSIAFRYIEGHRVTPNFQHGNGQAWMPEDRMYVELLPGDWLKYSFVLSDSTIVSELRIRVWFPDQEGELSIDINNTPAGKWSGSESEWYIDTLTKELTLASGQHHLTLRAASRVCLEWLSILPLK